VALANSGWLTLALPALSFLYYCAVGGGMLLAWRFHSSRTFLALLVIFLAQQATSPGQTTAPSAMQAIVVLVPVDFVLIALMHERGFAIDSVAPIGLIILLQSLTVAVFLGSSASGRPSPLVHAHHAWEPVALPRYAVLVLTSAVVFFIVRFVLTRKPVDSALLWSMFAVVLAMRFVGVTRVSTMYWAAGACILAASIVESSYLLAYHDELTTLPSRRAFNDALLRLKDPYSIAVVDIDHFKRFNDTYGHDTGDQVLRLVASNLAQVTGGGQAYRCGGEEFMIVFAGKTTNDVLEHLERLRETIQSSEFHLRGNDRRQLPRGAERRTERNRSRVRKGDTIRQLAEESSALSVTVSIGIATSSQKLDCDAVLKAADKALYRAKENGRNRVETASLVRRGAKSKAAGIA